MLIRILSTIAYRLQRKIAAHRGRLACIPQGKLTCGSNALIHNHGARANISVGHGVILDGILECYERGRLIVDEFSYVGNSRIFAAERAPLTATARVDQLGRQVREELRAVHKWADLSSAV